MEEIAELDEEATETVRLVDSVLLASEDAVVGKTAALELLRTLDELAPAEFPDLVALTEDS